MNEIRYKILNEFYERATAASLAARDTPRPALTKAVVSILNPTRRLYRAAGPDHF
jgi:hypothetical protein